METQDITERRAQAARIAGCADLQDIRLLSAECDLNHFGAHNALASDQSIEVVLSEPDEDSTVFIVYVTVGITITDAVDPSADDDELQPEPRSTKIECQYGALYEVPPDFHAELEEYQAFGESVGLLALYPYARELVQTLTTRMGLPPLVLPILRQPLPPEYHPQQLAAASAAQLTT